MTYYNPVNKYGLTRIQPMRPTQGSTSILRTCRLKKRREWKTAADAAGLATIQLVAPTSTKERIELGAKMASGFIYCVSRTGVTGARSDVPVELEALVETIKKASDLPVAVGFGISTPEHVRRVTAFADGAVVGSALVNAIAASTSSGDAVERAGELVKSLKNGASS